MIETSVRETGYGRADGLSFGWEAVPISAAGQAGGLMAGNAAGKDRSWARLRDLKTKQKVLDTGPHCRAHLPGEKPGGSAS